jgi:hypothetical protein
MREAVVEKGTVAIDECPQESDSEQHKTCKPSEIADDRLSPSERTPVAGYELQPPRLHRECCATMQPLPGEIHAGDGRQVELVYGPDVRGAEILFDRREGQADAPQHCGEKERVIEK